MDKLDQSQFQTISKSSISPFMGWLKLDMSDLIDSNVNLFMYLNKSFDIWTGPNAHVIGLPQG